VQFNADDVQALWLRGERYVGSSTFSAANNWAELDACSAGAWTLIALAVAPRGTPAAIARSGGAGGALHAAAAVGAAAAPRSAPLEPVALGRAAGRPAATPRPAAARAAAVPAHAAAQGGAASSLLMRASRKCWTCRQMFSPADAHPDDPSSCNKCV